MAMVPGACVAVVVDSGLGSPRLLAVPVGVRLPASVRLVAGAMAVAAEGPSRGRRCVLAAAAGNGGVSLGVLPDYTMSSGAGFFGSAAGTGAGFLFGSAGGGALAAARRASQSNGGVVVAASAGSPADDGGVDDDDATHEIQEEDKQIKEKEEWMQGWNTEPAQNGVLRYQAWLILPPEDGASKEEMTPVTDMVVTDMEHVLQLIKDLQRTRRAANSHMFAKNTPCGSFLNGRSSSTEFY